jgi:hypothetical protein
MTAIHYNLGWPNKPMVRTATRALAEPARRSRQRHIGQPLGGPGAAESQWAASDLPWT